jgi:hypothetical protein
VMDADGSGVTRVTTDSLDDREPSWAPDGNRLVSARLVPTADPRFPCSYLVVATVAGGETPLDPTPGCERTPEWSPLGNRIAFALRSNGVYTVDPDGSGIFEVNAFGDDPHWSPGAVWLGIGEYAHGLDGTRYEFRTGGAKWSPDGSRLVFGFEDVVHVNERLGDRQMPAADIEALEKDPDWQPLPPPPPHPGYARPRGATPMHMSLVPTYRGCDAPDRTHGPPLAFGSCSDPVPASDHLTVGTADSNGQPSKFIGSVRFEVLLGDPGTAADEADVALEVTITDVRCRSAVQACTGAALSDYTGALEAVLPLRITDRFNSGLGTQPGTADAPFQSRIRVPCAATADTSAGSTCSLHTTLDAVRPGQVREGKRAIWALGQVEVVDGGVDGDPATDDYTQFAVSGVFVP